MSTQNIFSVQISGAENENESVAAFPEPRFQASWEPKKKRVLKFEMNDGTRSVYGMEWNPIKKLHDKVIRTVGLDWSTMY